MVYCCRSQFPAAVLASQEVQRADGAANDAQVPQHATDVTSPLSTTGFPLSVH